MKTLEDYTEIRKAYFVEGKSIRATWASPGLAETAQYPAFAQNEISFPLPLSGL